MVASVCTGTIGWWSCLRGYPCTCRICLFNLALCRIPEVSSLIESNNAGLSVCQTNRRAIIHVLAYASAYFRPTFATGRLQDIGIPMLDLTTVQCDQNDLQTFAHEARTLELFATLQDTLPDRFLCHCRRQSLHFRHPCYHDQRPSRHTSLCKDHGRCRRRGDRRGKLCIGASCRW